MGLYGNVLVEPADPDYWPPVHREVVLTLDDILLEDGKVAPFSRAETTYAAMGRFGDVLLVSGEPDLTLTVQLGEVVRLYLTNTANTRVFKVKLPGARMKLVGGDSGHVEHEEFVDDVILAPSERVVVDVLFDRAGGLALEHHTPDRVYPLAAITVGEEAAELPLSEQFAVLRTNPDMAAERERVAPYLEAEPHKTVAFIAEMDMGAPEGEGAVAYTCPMHPQVVSEQPGHCPDCGMKLLRWWRAAQHGRRSWSHDQAGTDESRAPRGHAAAGGIEWEDDMVAVNRMTTPANMRWKIIDRATNAENAAIDWQFRVGDQVKIRLLNEMAGDHPMHHPFHVHGAGRFLVLARDDVPEPNLVWKDTVLVRTGETVDILLDVTNVGRWMAHCHIAEHHESGMMFSFDVAQHESERREVIVVGGGQAGLAIGYLLAQQGRRFTILEAADTPAAAWRERWDSLRLFTPVRYDSLPGRAFPGDPDSYPGRDDVVAYLSDYARDFELPVELGSRVRAVRQGDGGYLVELDDRAYEADQVVIATGPFQIPRVPPLAERLDRGITQLHSSRYRGPQDVPAGPVLVVGGGNTGYQIAEELARPTRCTCRSGPARRRCRSGSWAATCSATSRPRA